MAKICLMVGKVMTAYLVLEATTSFMVRLETISYQVI
ncbi:Uncharacterised protein [Aquipseudomonas alcaligenes]|uniref:Uncharacterized protein n=1 Tax=Aquipseudomonas alcaligenes TaxID=43263 RepID=A0A1N6NR30_AQUAC|nr:hypothetical protein SAMN05878282_101480 [Pseudomonas alcaligenes]SUD13215.1 Uncharacterised protein [Pseudomonas alcaligenes]